MNVRLIRKKASAAFAAAVAVLAVFFACAGTAEARDVMAYSYTETGMPIQYFSTDAAIQAGYQGKTIYLEVDWDFTGSMAVDKNKSITINMNGHKITSQGNGSVIKMGDKSSLTLIGGDAKSFTYTGYTNKSWSQVECTAETGGLITGGKADNGGGIYTGDKCTVTIDNVVVGGNSAENGGGIFAQEDCNIYLKNTASVQCNYASGEEDSDKDDCGAGIYVDDDDTNIYMDNATISKNFARCHGGGIYSHDNGTRIYMENGSAISENHAIYGGGVYFDYSYFNIASDDKTGCITDNDATGTDFVIISDGGLGGAVYAAPQRSGSNAAGIRGITFSGNSASEDAGAILFNSENVTLTDCVFTGNHCGKDGGALYVNNDGITLENCTITGNYCNGKNSDYAGGGVCVASTDDLKLSGVCNIKGNTRGEGGSADDVFLESGICKAYLTGSVDKGSNVGVRVSSTGDCKIGNKISWGSTNCFFMDLSDYYVDYSTEKELWQRKGTKDYPVTVNGERIGTFRTFDYVLADGSTSEAGKHFWYWDGEASEGLTPKSGFFADWLIYNHIYTFHYPPDESHVSLVTVNADCVQKATLAVSQPIVGQELVTTAGFTRTDEGTGWSGSLDGLAVTWYEVASDGTKTLATGVAKSGVKYVASVSVSKNDKEGRFFDETLKASGITVEAGETKHEAASIAIDGDGALTVETDQIEADSLTVSSVEPASISVTTGASKADLLSALPTSVKAVLSNNDTVTLATNCSGEIEGLDELLDGDSVLDPGSEAKEYTIKVPLASSSVVSDAESNSVEVTVTVLPQDKVAAPTLSPAAGTYFTNIDTAVLVDSLNLKVTAECATEGASIKYRVNGSDPVDYDASKGIVLKGQQNGKVTYVLDVWAEKGTAEPTHTKPTYIINDKLDKSITVKCSDTAKYAEGDTPWAPSFTVTGDIGSTVSVVAPKQDGRVFDHWEWDNAPDGTDLTQETLSISKFSANYSEEITAVYVPVVTKIDLGIEVPQADKALAQTASYVKVGVGDAAASTDITQYFADGAKIEWSPASTSGNAAHNTFYMAVLKLSGVSSDDGVKYALAENPAVYINGVPAKDLDGGAYAAEDSLGVTSLYAVFPNTGAYEYESLTQPDDIELTFAEASSCASGDKLGWGLPDQVEVSYKCGEKAALDVEWSDVEGFDADATDSQELTVTGKVKYPENVDNEDAPTTVKVKIRVAAPEQVATPAASVEAGTYTAAQSVELSCETEGATIRYTTDGTEPTSKSDVYDGTPIEVSTSMTVKAKAFCKNMTASDVASFSYTITHKVAFDTDEGSEISDQTVEDGKRAKKPEDPTKDGYTFKGWYADEALTKEFDFDAAITADTTVYAKWEKDVEPEPEPKKVTVTFMDGDDVLSTQKVEDGATAAKPEDPTKDGYTFKGWYADADLKTEFDFSSEITADTTVYAKWEKNAEPEPAVYTVTFMDGDEELSTQQVEEGKAAVKPEGPAKDGYTFKGWYADEALTKEFDFAAAVTSDTTVYAKWEKDADPEPEPEPDEPDEPVTPDTPSDKTDGGATETKTETVTETVTTAAQATENKKASAMPATGDDTFVTVIGLAAAGIVVLVAAVVVYRRNRG